MSLDRTETERLLQVLDSIHEPVDRLCEKLKNREYDQLLTCIIDQDAVAEAIGWLRKGNLNPMADRLHRLNETVKERLIDRMCVYPQQYAAMDDEADRQRMREDHMTILLGDASRYCEFLQEVRSQVAKGPLIDPGNEASEPEPATGITMAALRNMTGLKNTALNKRAKEIGVRTAGRGKRNYRFPLADVARILRHIIDKTSERHTLSKCTESLENLLRNHPEIAD